MEAMATTTADVRELAHIADYEGFVAGSGLGLAGGCFWRHRRVQELFKSLWRILLHFGCLNHSPQKTTSFFLHGQAHFLFQRFYRTFICGCTRLVANGFGAARQIRRAFLSQMLIAEATQQSRHDLSVHGTPARPSRLFNFFLQFRKHAQSKRRNAARWSGCDLGCASHSYAV